MDSHIDWLSFTLVRPDQQQHENSCKSLMELRYEAEELLRRVSHEHRTYVFNGFGFEACGGRAPYRYALGRDDGGVRCFGGGPQSGVLYELSGRACEGIRSFAAASAFLAPIMERITRLDIAADIRSECRPGEFANARSHQGFRSTSFIKSDTGETVYVGSPKSDRFCRVYRYNKPHPRAELLRVEFVFRRGLARDAARSLLRAKDFSEFVALLGNTYGWRHRIWQPGHQTDERLSVPIITRGNEDTVRWLYVQVVPALRRMIAEGAIDVTDFLEEVYRPPE